MKTLKGTRSGYLMALPALLAIVAIVAYPLAFATYYSLRRVLPGLPGEFVGLENYSRMLEDPHFAEALKTTLVFTATSGGLSFLAGLGLALLLSKPFPGRGTLAVAAFLPWVFPPVVVATFGRLALFSGVGPVSRAVEVLGFGSGELLLLSVAVLVDAWRTAPLVGLLLLAGLGTIPEDVYEAARVDGANALQRFFRITLPLLRPVLLVVLLLRLLDAFRVFDLFMVLGDQNLDSLSTYVYQDVMLSQIHFGLGNAAAVFMFLCAFLASLFFALILRAQASSGLAHSGLQRDSRRDGRHRAGGREIRAHARGARRDALGAVPRTAGVGLLGEHRAGIGGGRRRYHGPFTALLPHGPPIYGPHDGTPQQRHHSGEHGRPDARTRLPRGIRPGSLRPALLQRFARHHARHRVLPAGGPARATPRATQGEWSHRHPAGSDSPRHGLLPALRDLAARDLLPRVARRGRGRGEGRRRKHVAGAHRGRHAARRSLPVCHGGVRVRARLERADLRLYLHPR